MLVAVVTTRRLPASYSEADRGGYDVVPDEDRAAPVTVRGLLGELIEQALSPGPADWPASAEAWKALS
ncbi:hypothetical protein [Streptomyces sp. NPDC126933]|uniref:hypothetical protein n=1 Tax=unclassified Streptomyces TaxID=2593676 RepID=UPI00364F7614